MDGTRPTTLAGMVAYLDHVADESYVHGLFGEDDETDLELLRPAPCRATARRVDTTTRGLTTAKGGTIAMAREQLSHLTYSELSALVRRLLETAKTVRNPSLHADLHQAAGAISDLASVRDIPNVSPSRYRARPCAPPLART